MNVKSTSTSLKKIRQNIEQNLTIESKLASLARQQPNKRTLGVGLSLRMYNLFYTEKDSGVWYFLMTHLGNPPVLFDSTTLPTSARMMHDYLTSKGYLFPDVTYNYRITKRKKAKVKYNIVTGPLYTIDTVFFPTDSTRLDLIVAASRFKTQLISGDAFDADRLGKEQKRIHREFLDIGYFYFRKEFIFFEVDTNIGGHRVNVYVKTVEVDTAAEQEQYTVRNIYLYPDFNPQYDIDMVKFDTIIYDGFRFLTTKRYVDPDVLSSAVFMVQGALYSRSSFDCTLNRISDLGIFKFANARFNDVGGHMLDCRL